MTETSASSAAFRATAAADHLSPAFPDRAARGTVQKLRAWQQEALEAYARAGRKDFLVAATPGAGKTTFALRLASTLLQERVIDRVTVVAPTEHLKVQWADAAHRAGIHLDPRFSNRHRREGRGYHGVVVTYAQVAVRAALHRQLTESARSLVILDEVHHAGDALSWGDAVREAFEPAERRLSLSGTPFRSDTAPIPFVDYAPNERGIRLSRTDYSYGYGHALRDGVVRPVIFLSYAGSMRWRTRQGDEMEARLGQDDTKDVTSQAWRAALDAGGEWIPAVLTAADRRLTEVRHAVPDAGGLVIATDQTQARAYAEILTQITGYEPVVVLSDDAGASERIEQFSNGSQRWMVAVRMVSEGVDVPRLAVGVYATSASTPLFFAQAIGRFVRARRRGELASIFLPSVPILTELAAQLERERDHALDKDTDDDAGLLDDSLIESANREEKASEALVDEFTWQALGSVAEFEKVMFDGHEFGQLAEPGSDEEWDFIGLPGLLEPEQVSDLLRQRQARQSRRAEERRRQMPEAERIAAEPVALHRTMAEQRKLLNSLVSIQARNSGMTHGQVHAEVRRLCGGPEVAKATVVQLQARIEHLRRRLHHG
ncbi:DEAD/DEAH box helicase [Schumannella soli]|uniref:DEAD/DEAH box helicase n=1 Tax=Schumannella soli TaxID=2590779 RepID=A0A506Y2G9_9MICO|nr:DEAD/DEAH box helicase [Schumannella soli]TPW76235.1 DEAD/DEAH box helicase [Schumannella soli]